MTRNLWHRLISPKHTEQLASAQRAVCEQQEALRHTDRRDRAVNRVVQRLYDDLQKNNYGPNVARALGRRT